MTGHKNRTRYNNVFFVYLVTQAHEGVFLEVGKRTKMLCGYGDCACLCFVLSEVLLFTTPWHGVAPRFRHSRDNFSVMRIAQLLIQRPTPFPHPIFLH